jgi:hypothetical protein
MKQLRIMAPFLAAVMVLGSVAIAAAAPSTGVMVLHGFVMIDGMPAPKGTVVKAKLGDHTEIANTTTGLDGMAANQWRLDIQISREWEGAPVYLKANGASGNLASVTLQANRARGVDLTGYSNGYPMGLHSPIRAAAQSDAMSAGVTVFHGWVTVNGKAAPKGTVVTASIGKAVLGSSATGENGLAANQYRMDVQSAAWMQDKTVSLSIDGKQMATATFAANRAISRDLVSGWSPFAAVSQFIAAKSSSIASSAGVAVLHGYVTLNGKAAPAGTTVTLIRASDGSVLATTTTGADGLAANQYRFDVQSDAALNESQVLLSAGSAEVSVTFRANRAISMDIHSR